MADDPHDEVIPQKQDTASSDDLSPLALDGITTPERRRPGRVEEVSSALVPILREEGLENPDCLEARSNDLDSARGLITGLGMGVALWILVIAFFYVIYRMISR